MQPFSYYGLQILIVELTSVYGVVEWPFDQYSWLFFIEASPQVSYNSVDMKTHSFGKWQDQARTLRVLKVKLIINKTYLFLVILLARRLKLLLIVTALKVS